MASAAAAAAKAVPATSSASSSSSSVLRHMLAPSLSSFHAELCESPAQSRVACVDLSPTHVHVAVSDVSRGQAAPFGVLCRTSSVRADAMLLSSAFARAAELSQAPTVPIRSPEPRDMPPHYYADAAANVPPFEVAGLVLSVRPPAADQAPALLDLAAALVDQQALPGLRAAVLFSEAHAWRYALARANDVAHAIRLLPPKTETNRRHRFDDAMFPVVGPDDLLKDAPDPDAPSTAEIAEKDRICASEVLQKVLDDMARLAREARREQQDGEEQGQSVR